MIDTGATFMTRLRNEIAADSTVRNAQNQMILPAILDSVEELTGVMSQTPPPASPADFSSNLGLRVRDGEMEEMYYSPFVLHVWRGQTHMLAPPTYISLESLGIQRAQQLCLSMPFPADLPTLQVRPFKFDGLPRRIALHATNCGVRTTHRQRTTAASGIRVLFDSHPQEISAAEKCVRVRAQRRHQLGHEELRLILVGCAKRRRYCRPEPTVPV
jgi:hypothetical protein